MGFFEKFGIRFGSKKNKYLPGTIANNNSIESTMFTPMDKSAYKTIAMFDIKLESPKYEGAIPEATVKFYPLK